ncbi:unnamed protein product, partial [Closterium sp. NIES-53]
DHFLALDPTYLPVDLLEQHLLAAETSVVAVGAALGTPRTPFFEGCSPSPLAPSYASAAAVDVFGAEDVGAASASAKHRSSKGKGGRSGGGGSRDGSGGGSRGGGGSGGGGSGGSGGGSGGFGGGGGGSGGSGGSGGGGSGGSRGGAVQRGDSGGGQRQQQERRSKTPSPQQLCEWFAQRGASRGSVSCPYVIRTGDRAGLTCGKPHTQHHCFSCLDDAWRAEFGDEAERTRWAELLSVYTLATKPPQLAASAQVSASGPIAPPCSSRLLSHQTLLWHHRLGHPSLPHLRGMHSHLLVSDLPRSLPPLPPLPAPPCLTCVEGWQRAAPHSSFPPTSAPLQTLHMDVGPNPHHKDEIPDVLIPWIRTVRLQLCEWFRADLPVLRLHSDRGGEFSSDLLREFFRGEGNL